MFFFIVNSNLMKNLHNHNPRNEQKQQKTTNNRQETRNNKEMIVSDIRKMIVALVVLQLIYNS